jgi:hypothetical protein
LRLKQVSGDWFYVQPSKINRSRGLKVSTSSGEREGDRLVISDRLEAGRPIVSLERVQSDSFQQHVSRKRFGVCSRSLILVDGGRDRCTSGSGRSGILFTEPAPRNRIVVARPRFAGGFHDLRTQTTCFADVTSMACTEAGWSSSALVHSLIPVVDHGIAFWQSPRLLQAREGVSGTTEGRKLQVVSPLRVTSFTPTLS